MINLYNCKQIRNLEQLSLTKHGIAEADLMARAGTAAFDMLKQHWPNAKKIAVCCGAGNNGGDGYVLARLAHLADLSVVIYRVGDHNHSSSVARDAYQQCVQAGVNITDFQSPDLTTAELIVDALLGIGLSGEVRAPYDSVIKTINASGVSVLSLDNPSGLCVDTGQVLGASVKANMTITFIGMKQGLFTGNGPEYAGRVGLNTLDLPTAVYTSIKPQTYLLDLTDYKQALPKRSRNANKGDFGHVLVIGGNHSMAGAVRMAGEAAYRVGSGLVSVATLAEHTNAVTRACPELMSHAVQTADDIIALYKKANVLVLGPGLGQDAWAKLCWDTAMAADMAMVLDADGLNILANHQRSNNNWILTPHPGEAARLLSVSTSVIQADRFAAAKKLQQQYAGVVVLKGAGTIIQTHDKTFVCPYGNPGMASGGMGDVLSGVIGGLLAQGLPLDQAASFGVAIHGKAGDMAAVDGERGLMAMDLMRPIHQLVNT